MQLKDFHGFPESVKAFEKNGIKTIHRAIKVRNVDGKVAITTKGDANKEADSGYVTLDNVQGLIKLRIKYIGRPTIWINDIFNKE